MGLFQNASNYLQGKTLVDNEADPYSAYSRAKERRRIAAPGMSAQAKALQKKLDKIYGPNSKVKTFGAPDYK